MFSTLSSLIYLPALTPISKALNVSLTFMNLTVISYMVVAGIAPAFMGDLADQSGRRPICILLFILMLGANLGTTTLSKRSVLFVLRMLLSASASATVSVADVTGKCTRMLMRGSIIMAPTLGPVLGGVLADKLGWRCIFWFMSVLTGSTLLILIMFLPETQRRIVGDGLKPARGIYWSLMFPNCHATRPLQNEGAQEQNKKKYRFPNPLTCVSVLAHKGSLFTILIGAIAYVNLITLLTSLASLTIDIYDLTYLQAGLIYLPSGVSAAVSSKLTGIAAPPPCPRASSVDWRRQVSRLEFPSRVSQV
ncbi:hypothetical protein AK830_g5693 [Neonectria ditissima]|uniref:Major facilitator superfamily (MFS) profile domain-containing protein n=1 Tax=Neonectria ditissima TaxID=78410 RepID=A0A0P7BKI8_9HYPO|nr:hypothetical protein AK830_g5693 [Neonectria ditissima]